jgi:amidase
MRNTQTRREFLLAASAAATLPMPTVAAAQERSPARRPALEYQTAEALLAALTAREISAVELTNHAIARIESLDPRINAVVVRDFKRAVMAAAGQIRLLQPASGGRC